MHQYLQRSLFKVPGVTRSPNISADKAERTNTRPVIVFPVARVDVSNDNEPFR